MTNIKVRLKTSFTVNMDNFTMEFAMKHFKVVCFSYSCLINEKKNVYKPNFNN